MEISKKVAQEEWNQQQEQVEQPQINLNRQQASQGTPDPKAETWASRNAWFGQDTALRYSQSKLGEKPLFAAPYISVRLQVFNKRHSSRPGN